MRRGGRLALVTGANGLIGSAIVRELLDCGWRVRGLARPDSRLDSLEGLDLQIARGDVLEPDTLAAAAAGCEVVLSYGDLFCL